MARLHSLGDVRRIYRMTRVEAGIHLIPIARSQPYLDQYQVDLADATIVPLACRHHLIFQLPSAIEKVPGALFFQTEQGSVPS